MGPEFWVGVSFFIFLGILYFSGVPGKIITVLDERSNKISAQLAEAERLRNEAAALLETYEKKRKTAEKDAKAIVESAKLEAERLENEAKKKLDEFIKRRTLQAEQKIKQAEDQLIKDVRAAVMEQATQAAVSILSLSPSQKVFDEGIEQLKKQVHTKQVQMSK